MTFQQFFLIIRARWFVIVAVLCLVSGTTLTVCLLTPKQYTATASILIDMKATDPLYGSMVQALPGYMATQVDIISSDRVAERVVRLLGYDKNPEAVATWREETEGKGTVESYYAAGLKKRLGVKPSKESNVISIEFTHLEPRAAMLMANAFARSYVETTLELKVEPAKEYAGWFGDRTKQLRDTLEKAQAKLSAFQQENGIVATDERLDVENSRLIDLSTQLTGVQAQRSDSSSRKREASERMSASPDVINSPVIQSLRAEVVRQEVKIKEMSEQYGRNHPLYQRAQTELETLKSKLDSEMRQVASSVGSSNSVNVQRESELRAALDAQKKKVLQLRALRDQLQVLQRDVETAQRTYDLVSQRLSQTNLESQTQQTNVVILGPAQEPAVPSSPKTTRSTLLSVFVGLILGVGGAMLLEVRNPRIRSMKELTDVLEIPILAEFSPSRKIRKGVWRRMGLA